jgi:hypothetical protein
MGSRMQRAFCLLNAGLLIDLIFSHHSESLFLEEYKYNLLSSSVTPKIFPYVKRPTFISI